MKTKIFIDIPEPEANEPYWDLFAEDGIDIIIDGIETLEDAKLMQKFMINVLKNCGFECDGEGYWLHIGRFTWEGFILDYSGMFDYDSNNHTLSVFQSGQGVVEDCETDEIFNKNEIRKVKKEISNIKNRIKRLFREFTIGEASVFNCIKEIRNITPLPKYREFINIIKWNSVYTTNKKGKKTVIHITISLSHNNKHYWYNLNDISFWISGWKKKSHKWFIKLSMSTPTKEFFNKEFRTMKEFKKLLGV